ncbi:MAG: thioredoxin [Desulfuromonas sp.]|nr:MAG: thioredoxin [Desulfuromonas sp.]
MSSAGIKSAWNLALKLCLAGILLFAALGSAFANPVPRLVDVGADKCIPCIKMAPILDQLKKDFAGRMEVKFVDAWKNQEEAAGYGVRMIPTQIFYAADGKELFRHTGFFSREEILGKWLELGYSFDTGKP